MCICMQEIANFTLSDLACPDLDTEEGLDAQNLTNQRYGCDKAPGIALETKHIINIAKCH